MIDMEEFETQNLKIRKFKLEDAKMYIKIWELKKNFLSVWDIICIKQLGKLKL